EPPAGGGPDELPPDGGSGIGAGGTVTVGGVVVVGAVVAGACRAGCVVVGEDVVVGCLNGDTVVVDQRRPCSECQRQPLDTSERLRRCADATGIDIASTTDTAVITTIAVRSL